MKAPAKLAYRLFYREVRAYYGYYGHLMALDRRPSCPRLLLAAQESFIRSFDDDPLATPLRDRPRPLPEAEW
jgi:hypothetical protein